ncbi:alpha/beta fold hydrolase [Fictibacillus sp. BK138]|uniref:alpha/beta fold hydrolase n=1 Tax=Fictibacillus sp. BK138 TaxID=2512121 RepID=UPI001029F0B9|nr:alpha/beta hydrolase [Fictibacillus sp. BK138]RZT15505.1 proline iminopeptidase [Fictibacillus sp. BK138]
MVLTEHQIKINGTNIFLKIIGNGDPIIFLHGGPGGEHGFFLPHIEPLSNDYQLIFYDQKGCGKSDPAIDGVYSMEDEVETLEKLRVELSLERVNLFGESWGSMLALLYAIKYPENVNKILLTAAVGSTAEGFKVFGEEMNNRMTVEDKVKLSALETEFKKGKATLDDIFKVLNPYYVYSKETLMRKTKTKSNLEVNQILGKDIQENYDLRNQLESVSHIPILVAQGSHDIITPELIQQLLIRDIPHAELVVIQECGHWTVVEKPQEMIQLAKEFF